MPGVNPGPTCRRPYRGWEGCRKGAQKWALRQIGMTKFGVLDLFESIGNRSLTDDLRFPIFEMGSA